MSLIKKHCIHFHNSHNGFHVNILILNFIYSVIYFQLILLIRKLKFRMIKGVASGNSAHQW